MKKVFAVVILVVIVIVAKQTFAQTEKTTEGFKLQQQVQKI